MGLFSQLFPPAPAFTEKSLDDLSGRVYMITGAASGIGLELAKILYSKHATVYVIARSQERARAGIKAISNSVPVAHGRLEPLAMDLASLASIKPAVQEFLDREQRLDVLFLNAGVMLPPKDSKSVDGYDLEVATNCLGPFLLARLLENRLRETAALPNTSPYTVRTIWVASLMDLATPKNGVVLDANGSPAQLEGMENYMQSKAGTVFLGAEFAKRWAGLGVLSIGLNPGLMRTELQRHGPAIQQRIMGLVFKSPKFGAYTELYAGLSPQLTEADNGAYLIPWGRKGQLPQHLMDSMRAEDMEVAISGQFFAWCEAQVTKFL